MQPNDGDRAKIEKVETYEQFLAEMERLGYERLGPNFWRKKTGRPVASPVLAMITRLAQVARKKLPELAS
jgi:hypothetical protein